MTTHAEIARQAMVHGASQHEGELILVLDLISSVSPKVILEIGCDQGGSLYAWRGLCDRVYGITLPVNDWESGGSGQPLTSHGAEIILGDSHDSRTLSDVLSLLGGDQLDVLVLDGDHHTEAVRLDLIAYGNLVRPGGLILIHDINCLYDPRAETWKIWDELQERYQTSEVRLAASGAGWGWGVIHVREQDGF